jgi:hypothetical protein
MQDKLFYIQAVQDRAKGETGRLVAGPYASEAQAKANQDYAMREYAARKHHPEWLEGATISIGRSDDWLPTALGPVEAKGQTPGPSPLAGSGETGVQAKTIAMSDKPPAATPPRPSMPDSSGPASVHQHGESVRVRPGEGNPLDWRETTSFDLHDAKGKIGYLAGYMGGPWSEKEFRVTHVEITDPGRRLTPGEWKSVLRGLREQLPDAEYIGGNRTGEGGDLSPAYEKLIGLPPAAREPSPALMPDASQRAAFQPPVPKKGVSQ